MKPAGDASRRNPKGTARRRTSVTARSSCCSTTSPRGGRRALRVLQVGSRALVSDRNERNWRNLVAKRFGSRAAFVGIDLLEGSNVDHVLDICSEPRSLKAKLGQDPFDLVICCMCSSTPASRRRLRTTSKDC